MMYQVIKSTRSLAASKGKWVARAIHPQIIDTRRIANEMETGSTLKRSDVRAVICELGEAMAGHLRDGHIVDLRGIGRFKLELDSKPTDLREDFDRSKIKGVHCIFTPDKVDSVKPMYSDIEFNELKEK